jgi:hypothetical protein
MARLTDISLATSVWIYLVSLSKADDKKMSNGEH